MSALKSIRLHLHYIFRKKSYWFYISIIYFMFSFLNLELFFTEDIFISDYSDYISRLADQQLIIGLTLILTVVITLSEEYMDIYKNLFCIYVQRPTGYFTSLALSIIIANLIPFILGQLLFFILNTIMTGLCPWNLLLGNFTIVMLETIALILFAVGLFILFHKTALTLLAYILFTLFSAMLSSPYYSIPLFASVSKHPNGGYYTFPPDLFIGRFLILGAAILFFYSVLKHFIKCSTRL
ncbi:MAG: hypothetical protein E7231_12220 [Cellulosilyticum sp.]|nr:hypothetical protein [Cellulosilyticum sp.]